MKILMIILSGVILVNNHSIDKTQLETITGTKVVIQGKVPMAAPKKATQAKKSAKITSKKKVIKRKNVKKSQKAKKYVKKTKKKTTKRVRYNVGEIQSYAHQLVIEYRWTEEDYQALVHLWYRESGWNPNAINKKSGACGIPQSLPCRKMASEGKDYRTNYRTQVRWGLKYIKARYGSPRGAWEHSQRTGWY